VYDSLNDKILRILNAENTPFAFKEQILIIETHPTYE